MSTRRVAKKKWGKNNIIFVYPYWDGHGKDVKKKLETNARETHLTRLRERGNLDAWAVIQRKRERHPRRVGKGIRGQHLLAPLSCVPGTAP